MVELDLFHQEKDFKTTEFISENYIPNFIKIINSFYVFDYSAPYESHKGDTKIYNIEILLKRRPALEYINKNGQIKLEASHYSSMHKNDKLNFKTTYYSFTDLRKMCNGAKDFIDNLNLVFYRAYINNLDMAKKNIRKEDMLAYLVYRQALENHKDPIIVVIQDEYLNQSSYGRAYGYEIVRSYVSSIEYENFNFK